MSGLSQALKEWDVICRALAAGQQAILLRKGGIAETQGEFQLEEARFWLFPTFLHQAPEGLIPEAAPLLEQSAREQPPPGVVRLTHFAEVPCSYRVDRVEDALALRGLHLYADETVRSRFEYRRPGLVVLPVRVWRVSQAHEIPDTAAYVGCRSWVQLDQELPTDSASPVLDEAAFRALLVKLDDLLQPTALA
jgi:hypothetical protein